MSDALAKAVARIVHAACETLHLDELTDAPLHALRDVTDAVGVVLYRHQGQGRLLSLGGDLAPVLDRYDPALFDADPTHRFPRRLTPRPRVVQATRQVDRRAFTRSRAYHDFYHPFELEHLTCLWLTHHPYASDGMTGLLIARAPSQGELDDPQLHLLAAVLPALSAAISRCERLDTLRRTRVGLEALIATLTPHACLILDPRGATLWTSPAADRLLDPHARQTLADAARALHRDALRGDAPALRLSLPRPALPPLRAELQRVSHHLEHPIIIAHLEAPERTPTLRWSRARVADRYALTPTELNVLHDLALGLPNRDIARRHDVSVETIRTHVKHILRKLNVHNRVQAALVVWSDEDP